MKFLPTLLFVAYTLPLSQNLDMNNRRAPEFPSVKAKFWLNSPPLKMADLRGKVVMLDIWTFM